MNTQYNGRMLASSVTIILCGMCNFIFSLLRKALNVINTVKDITQSGLEYKDVGTWTEILGSVGDIIALYNHSFNALTIIQFLSGAVGIILVTAINFKKTKAKAEKLVFIPFCFGILSCILGCISYIALLISRASSVFFCIVMLATMLIVSIIFTVFAYKFWKGEKI